MKTIRDYLDLIEKNQTQALTEFAPPTPRKWEDDNGDNIISFADLVKIISEYLGPGFTLKLSKHHKTKTAKFMPTDKSKGGPGMVYCGIDKFGRDYPTYFSNLGKFFHSGTIANNNVAAGTAYEKAEAFVRMTPSNARITAEKIFSNDAGALDG